MKVLVTLGLLFVLIAAPGCFRDTNEKVVVPQQKIKLQQLQDLDLEKR